MKLEIGSIVEFEINGKMEKFEIIKIGCKYIYYTSDQYSSDGLWFNLRSNPSGMIKRC
jgi:hypothetical protein